MRSFFSLSNNNISIIALYPKLLNLFLAMNNTNLVQAERILFASISSSISRISGFSFKKFSFYFSNERKPLNFSNVEFSLVMVSIE